MARKWVWVGLPRTAVPIERYGRTHGFAVPQHVPQISFRQSRIAQFSSCSARGKMADVNATDADASGADGGAAAETEQSMVRAFPNPPSAAEQMLRSAECIFGCRPRRRAAGSSGPTGRSTRTSDFCPTPR